MREVDAVRTVYLDAYLVISLAVNYVLLVCAGRLDGDRVDRSRCLAAASLGAVLGAASLFPWGGFLAHPAGQAAAGAGMVLTAYGSSDRLLRTGALFLVLSCAWGGSLLLLSRGPEGPLGMRGILVAAALGYGGLSLGLRGQFTHTRTGGELEPITLTHRGRQVTLLALRDTGNTLADPLTGGPVIVAEGRSLTPLLPGVDLNRLTDPVKQLEKIRMQAPGTAFQLLPYRSVGIDHGLLLALRLERAAWGDTVIQGCLAAISPTPVSDGGGYQVLVGEGVVRS